MFQPPTFAPCLSLHSLLRSYRRRCAHTYIHTYTHTYTYIYTRLFLFRRYGDASCRFYRNALTTVSVFEAILLPTRDLVEFFVWKSIRGKPRLCHFCLLRILPFPFPLSLSPSTDVTVCRKLKRHVYSRRSATPRVHDRFVRHPDTCTNPISAFYPKLTW